MTRSVRMLGIKVMVGLLAVLVLETGLPAQAPGEVAAPVTGQELPRGPIPGVGGRLFYMNSPSGAGNDWRIMMIDLDRAVTSVVIDLAGFFYWTDELDISPDGKTIAFVATPGAGADYEVWVVGSDGTGLHQVSSYPGASWPSTPRWSPKSSDVLYYLVWLNPYQDTLHRLNLTTGEDVKLFQGYGEATKGLDITTDESEALMIREPSCCSHPNAFTAYYDLDGGGASYRIIRPSDGRSEWGVRIDRSDGSIAYIDETTGGTGVVNVYVAAADGSSAVSITPGLSDRGIVHSATWVGRGLVKYVVATSTFAGQNELFALSTDSPSWPDGAIQLTAGPGMSRYAAWTPIPSGPDLVVSSVSNPPSAIAPGMAFPVTDTTLNQGASEAGASVTRYYLSADGLRSAGDRLLSGSHPVPPLKGGASSEATVQVKVPATMPLGTYRLLACADDRRAVVEVNEANNCLASESEVQVALPDLVVTSVGNPPSYAPQGGKFTLTDTTLNQGDGPAGPSTTRYYLSVDSVRDGSDVLLTGVRKVLGLPPGHPSPGSRKITVPLTAPLGSYYVLACADDLERVKEADETNNCFTSATKVLIYR